MAAICYINNNKSYILPKVKLSEEIQIPSQRELSLPAYQSIFPINDFCLPSNAFRFAGLVVTICIKKY